MLASMLIAATAITTTGPIQPARARDPGSGAAPYVELWTDRDDVVERGDRVRVYFQTDIDAYVTIFRVDTDGRVRVLFPLDPWDDNYARGGVPYEIQSRGGRFTFRVDDYPGQGYVFAVASADPFRYGGYVLGNHWDYRAIAEHGRIVGDPYVAFGDVIDVIVPPNYVSYSYDAVSYYVERRYDYPRFLCYDCHIYAAWPYWDPYHNPCFRFRIVVYDDPYYYPARRITGTQVVYRPRRTVVPRYVFRDRDPDQDYVVRVRERPVDDDGRRRSAAGATRRVLEGGTRIPAPLRRELRRPAETTRRRPAARPERATPAQRPRLERRDPARVDPRNRPAREPQRRAEPQRAATRRARPQRRNEPQRSPPRRPSRPKRRKN